MKPWDLAKKRGVTKAARRKIRKDRAHGRRTRKKKGHALRTMKWERERGYTE